MLVFDVESRREERQELAWLVMSQFFLHPKSAEVVFFSHSGENV